MSFRRGFSLIELLACIGFVGILAAILVLSVNNARTKSMGAKSTANLRQLATANLSYAAEHGTFAPAQDRDNRMRWHGYRTSIAAEFNASLGYLSPYLGKQGKVSKCPLLTQILEEREAASSFEDGTGGYGYNAAYLGGTSHYSPRSVAQPFLFPERPGNVVDPARTIMFTTVAWSRGAGLTEYAYTEPYYHYLWGRRLSSAIPSTHFRFNGKALVAWCDGSVTHEPPAELGLGPIGNNMIGWVGPRELNGFYNARHATPR